MIRCYVGLGANLHRPARQVTAALEAIDDIDRTQRLRASHLYRTSPWGKVDQPDFVNAVAEIETRLPASTLMAELLALEQRLGRRRDGARWGPRVIDLDLLLYGDEIIDLPGLQVPHPRMHQRGFVLRPLAELEPDRVIPGHGPIGELLARLPDEGLRVLEDPAERGNVP